RRVVRGGVRAPDPLRQAAVAALPCATELVDHDVVPDVAPVPRDRVVRVDPADDGGDLGGRVGVRAGGVVDDDAPDRARRDLAPADGLVRAPVGAGEDRGGEGGGGGRRGCRGGGQRSGGGRSSGGGQSSGRGLAQRIGRLGGRRDRSGAFRAAARGKRRELVRFGLPRVPDRELRIRDRALALA